MAENKTILRNTAMQYGTIMGLFWMAKFSLVPLGIRNPSLHVLFFILTLCVPFIGYYFARSFRVKECNNMLSYKRSVIFLILMYFYASLLVAVAHYIYFHFFDKGALMEFYKSSLIELKSTATGQVIDSINQIETTLDTFVTMSPLDLTFYFLSNNLFYCFIIAVITAFFVMRRKINTQS